MSNFLVLAFLFFIGSILGWVLELFFRRYFSDVNKEKKWINPGFCVGPYLPIYGFGLCILYLLARLKNYIPISTVIFKDIIMILIMGISLTILEYIAGYILLKFMNLRLWDYSHQKWNINGIICLTFTIDWTLLSAIYYFLIDPYILDALNWLANNLAFSFFIGMFFGVFIIDVVHSSELIVKIRQNAIENNIVVRIERLKKQIIDFHVSHNKKYNFFKPLKSDKSLHEYINELKEEFEKKNNKK